MECFPVIGTGRLSCYTKTFMMVTFFSYLSWSDAREKDTLNIFIIELIATGVLGKPVGIK